MSSATTDQFVRVQCPGCDASLKLKGAVRPGRRIQCPKCQGEVVIPENSVQSAAALAPAAVSARPVPQPKSPPKPKKKPSEDDWLDDLGSLDDTAVNLGDTAVLPPRVGAPKPRKSPSATIETRKPRKTSRRNREEGGFSLGMFGPIITAVCGGLIGGGVGAAIWATICALTGYEIGWIAWGLGALAGAGVRFGSGGEEGPLLGILAVLISFASIYVGKAIAIFCIARQMGLIPPDVEPIFAIIGSFALVPFVMSFWDVLWFALAGFTAFKIGSGLASDD